MIKYNQIQNFVISLVPLDKALHFILGFFIYVISNCFLSGLHSLLIVFIVALAKETRDEITYNGGDWKDVLFTVAPAVTLFVLFLLKQS